MAYRVNLTSRAQRDLILLFDDIHADTSDAAARWYAGLKAAILSLERNPNRCSIAPENKRSGICITDTSRISTASFIEFARRLSKWMCCTSGMVRGAVSKLGIFDNFP
ncbi:MAG TPA: type II toxin-antitoxin system RelE/ParE family toxin [Candidatus Dormibacteraeota bacterium]|nr:type II toxin-antitoxin system RelE/ParE family toxin [Candidatus Dormibacteraeota bacterium]